MGAYKNGTDKNGKPYYLHRLDNDAQRLAVDPPTRKLSSGRADEDALHRVYDALLANLILSSSHRDNLRKRGLPDEVIERGLYRSLPVQGRAKLARALGERFGMEALPLVPGFIVKKKDGGKIITIAGSAGLLVPVRSFDGKIVALKVRRDDAGEGPRYSYLSSSKHGGPSPGSPVHVPLGTPKTAESVGITEGELKADVAFAEGEMPVLSVQGIGSWKTVLPVLQQLGTKAVHILFDADAGEKEAVARALGDCYEELAAQHYHVRIGKWNAEYKGIDDLLAAGQRPEMLEGDAARAYVDVCLESSGAAEKKASPLDKLAEALSAGAEALFKDRGLIEALAALSENDPAEYACRRASIKNAGVSLRDLDRAISPFRQKLRAERPPLTAAGEYKASGGRIVHIRPTKDGPVELPLCNFVVRIAEQVTVDDGAETSIRLAIEGQLHDGAPLPRVEIPADKFGYMEWIIANWGTRAVVNAGAATKDRLRCAMQLLSGEVPTRTVYGHLGWKKIGEQWAYLHAGGGIGADGVVDGVETQLPDALQRYDLPEPPTGAALRDAVRASLALLDLGPARLMFPLLASTYRAPLGSTDFTIFPLGETQSFKSEVTALVQQHYGKDMIRGQLPGSWDSTANALQAQAFACKDAVLVVDDFVASGSANDQARLFREAERLLRGQGNGAGRGRMRRDGTLAPCRPSRALIVSSGETLPRGQSLIARLFTLAVKKGDIDPAKLSACQREAAEGLYAEAMAGYVRWLAPRIERLQTGLSAERDKLRDAVAGDGQQRRTPTTVADLAIGLRHFLDFAGEVGAIDQARHAALWQEGWAALREAGSEQEQHIGDADPVGRFLRLLNAALTSGRAHVASTAGDHPAFSSAWGWRKEHFRDGPEWRPQGKRIGWTSGEQLYIEPDAAFAVAQELASAQGESMTVSPKVLWGRMKERGQLASFDTTRQRNTVRKSIDGVKERNVIHLRVSTLWGNPPSDPSDSLAELTFDKEAEGQSGGESDSPPSDCKRPSDCDDEKNAEKQGVFESIGRFGRIGRSIEHTGGTEENNNCDQGSDSERGGEGDGRGDAWEPPSAPADELDNGYDPGMNPYR